MSIIFDALKKAQIKLSHRPGKDESAKSKEQASQLPPRPLSAKVNEATGFAFGEDLTQPLKPIEGSKPAEQPKFKSKAEVKSQVPATHKRRTWTVYDVRNMNSGAFIFFIFFGLLGCALVFYIFNYKLKDQFLIQAQDLPFSATSASARSGTTGTKKSGVEPAKKNLFYLSPEISLSLDGIVSSGGKNVALIDDQIVEVGDTIKGATVLSIGAREVALSFQGKEIILILK
jgi:hypothetical protein